MPKPLKDETGVDQQSGANLSTADIDSAHCLMGYGKIALSIF